MLAGQFSPGPDMLLLTRTSLAEGARAGVAMALGIATGLAVHATIAIGGMAALFDHVPWVREVLRWGAAAYLLWLAWRLGMEWFVKWYSGAIEETAAPPVTRTPYLRGLWCNLLNPKAVIFLAAVSAPFLRGGHPAWWPFALWGVIVFQGGFFWSLWAKLLQWPPLRERYRKARHLIDGCFALGLALLAVKLILGF